MGLDYRQAILAVSLQNRDRCNMRFTDNKSLRGIQKTAQILGFSLLLPAIALSVDYDVVVNSEGLVSMYGQNVAVEDIMNSLGSKLNITISFPTPVPDKVSVDFQELKLEQAIRQVTQSYILVTSKNDKNHGIKEIIVMPEGEASAYLPKEGELKQLLVQDGGDAALPPQEDNERKASRLKMLERIAKIKARTQVNVEESRLAEELKEQMGHGSPMPADMD